MVFPQKDIYGCLEPRPRLVGEIDSTWFAEDLNVANYSAERFRCVSVRGDHDVAPNLVAHSGGDYLGRRIIGVLGVPQPDTFQFSPVLSRFAGDTHEDHSPPCVNRARPVQSDRRSAGLNDGDMNYRLTAVRASSAAFGCRKIGRYLRARPYRRPNRLKVFDEKRWGVVVYADPTGFR